MIQYINQITGIWNIILSEVSNVVTYIDSYPVLYSVGILLIMVTVVQVFQRLARIN